MIELLFCTGVIAIWAGLRFSAIVVRKSTDDTASALEKFLEDA